MRKKNWFCTRPTCVLQDSARHARAFYWTPYATHVHFTGLRTPRTCILLDSARHARAFYWTPYATHVHFTGLRTPRTCILLDSVRHARAFYWTPHATHVHFTGLRTPRTCILLDSVRHARAFYWTPLATHVHFLSSFICLPLSFLSRHQMHYDGFPIFFLNLLDAHDNYFSIVQFTSSTTSKNCVMIAVTGSFLLIHLPNRQRFSVFAFLRSLIKKWKRSNKN